MALGLIACVGSSVHVPVVLVVDQFIEMVIAINCQI